MSNNKIHIVSFDIPYPDNYGGVIDVFHKIRFLHLAGWKITLHCFTYGRCQSLELEKYCECVYYYSRKTNKSHLISKTPYIVITRTHPELLVNLCKDDAPVLFEGLHTTFLLKNTAMKGRKKLVRTHNIEHEYYRNLSLLEKNPFKKLYYKSEALKLQHYEPVLAAADCLATISSYDQMYFNTKYNNASYLPAFHAYDQVLSIAGRGNFCLYHGNLSIAENHAAAMWLIEKVVPFLKLPVVIAGQKARIELREKTLNQPLVKLIENPSGEEMSRLIQEAQVLVLPAFQSSGIKLKLLHSLYRGRHIIATSMMSNESALSTLITVADTPESFAEKTTSLFTKDFTKEMISERESILLQYFSNARSLTLLENLINDQGQRSAHA